MRFAGRRTVGVVSETDVTPDIDPSRIQPVLDSASGLEPVSEQEINLWRFIANYYLCTLGEVYKAAYPPMKTASEETGARTAQRKETLEALTLAKWQQRVERLQARLDAIDEDLSHKHGEAVRQRLETRRDSVRKELKAAQEKLSSFDKGLGLGGQDWSLLLKNLPDALPNSVMTAAMSSGKPLLLKSSDRNPSYVQAAAEQLRKGRNVCILVNEIALAGQLCNSLKASFGDLLLIHHSQMTRPAQRRISDAIRSGRPYILVGTRSAIFLPHRDLGLIVVENEESPFYKQSDSAPRYNARDCAVQLAKIHACSIILGSVSPSLESILNARTGRYSLLDMNPSGQERHPGCKYSVIDITAEHKKNGMDGSLSRKLLKAMQFHMRTALIRGFEKLEDLQGLNAEVFTIPQAAKTDFSPYDLVAIINADALFAPANFRSDERAFQFLERLRSTCSKLIVQTRQAGHQVFSMGSADLLLEERRQFNLPPYSRLIELRLRDSRQLNKLCSTLSEAGFSPMPTTDTIRIALPRDPQLGARKKILRNIIETFRGSNKADIIADVDPA